MQGRQRERWSDREWELFGLLDQRGLVIDTWPNGRLLRDCRVCGSGFMPTRDGERGPFPIECSPECRRVYRAWNSEQWRQGKTETLRECAWCFGPMRDGSEHRRNQVRFCSRQCQLAAGNHRTSNEMMDRCEVPRCTLCGTQRRKVKTKDPAQRKFTRRGNGLCDDCRRQRERERNMDRPLRPGRVLRARAIAQGEKPTPAGVLKRCGSICYLCGEEIDLTITNRDDPGYLNIDHLIPLVRGGRDTYDNVAPTHRRCNNKKGIKLVGFTRWSDGPVRLL